LRGKGLDVIFENIGAILEKCRGIIEIVLLWWKGFSCEYNKGQGFICKKVKEWKGSL